MTESVKLSNGRTIKIGSTVSVVYPPVTQIELVNIEGFQFAKLTTEGEDKHLYWLTYEGLKDAQSQKKYRYSSPTSQLGGYIHLLLNQTGKQRNVVFFSITKLREFNALNLSVNGQYMGKQIVWHP